MKLTQKPNKINRQIVGLMTGVILIAMLLCYIITTCFLGDFYLYKKKSDMKRLYTSLEGYCADESLYNISSNNSIEATLSDVCCAAIIINGNNEVLFSNVSSTTGLLEDYTYIRSSSNNVELIATGSGYSLYQATFLDGVDSYLVLTGYLSDGNIVFAKLNIENADYITFVTDNFLIYVSLVVIGLAAIITYCVIKRFTRPLYDIIDITKHISNFDFNTKYKPQPIYNELDDLGEHINEMAISLERAIYQLRKANEKLKQDIELKDEAEKTRKEFVSNVSHELKTPIALIQGYAEGLQEGIMDDENSRKIYLDVIIDEANKMNRLVREMLILNQLEAGQMNLDMVDFDVTEMIDGIVDNNKIYFEAQNITYSFINKEECMVHADEFLVEQVVTNFISNAIHYVMNENVINVKYEFIKKGKVRISVFNSGNNIAKKDIKHIWEKFYKADKARSREYGGSGIGLSVVKATMKLLGEKVGVENKPDGVEFWFELSLCKNTKNNDEIL